MRSSFKPGLLQVYCHDVRGTVAVITALTVPVLLLAMLGGTTIMKALSQRRELQSIAQTACNRAVKPQRLVIFDDAARQKRAQDLFDNLAAERKFVINSRTVTTGWLTAQITAQATVKVVPGLGEQTAIPIKVTETCAGIPPYPKLNDVVLSSNFKKPDGDSVTLTRSGGTRGTWEVLTAQQVGWDGGDGPGVEIQDWANGFSLDGTNADYLAQGVSNSYVVELDSLANSSIYKNFELHPGTYRFSLRYFPRVPGNPNDTNRIAVYLEGTKPIVAKALKLEVPMRPTPLPSELVNAWTKRSFDFTVNSYGLYRLTVAAEGADDGKGGLFNDLQLKYIKRPAPEYNDPTPVN